MSRCPDWENNQIVELASPVCAFLAQPAFAVAIAGALSHVCPVLAARVRWVHCANEVQPTPG
jgi:hypothetical protein